MPKYLTHPAIQCRADAITGETYDIWVGPRFYRVTAYSRSDAEAYAAEYDRNRAEREAEERRDQEQLPL